MQFYLHQSALYLLCLVEASLGLEGLVGGGDSLEPGAEVVRFEARSVMIPEMTAVNLA